MMPTAWQNLALCAALGVCGSVTAANRESQRSAWTMVGRDSPILETGISNLTQNEASVLVHFADGQTQQWLMVRIENPSEESQ